MPLYSLYRLCTLAMSAIPEPFRQGGGLRTTQGACKHSGHWRLLVDGSLLLLEGCVANGPDGTPGLFLLGISVAK